MEPHLQRAPLPYFYKGENATKSGNAEVCLVVDDVRCQMYMSVIDMMYKNYTRELHAAEYFDIAICDVTCPESYVAENVRKYCLTSFQ